VVGVIDVVGGVVVVDSVIVDVEMVTVVVEGDEDVEGGLVDVVVLEVEVEVEIDEVEEG